jgi:hypothetical protein
MNIKTTSSRERHHMIFRNPQLLAVLLASLSTILPGVVAAYGGGSVAAASSGHASQQASSSAATPVMADGFVALNSHDWVNHNMLTWVCLEAPRKAFGPSLRRETCAKWVSPQDYINYIAGGRPLVFSGLGVNTGTNEVVLYYALDRSALPPGGDNAAPTLNTSSR